MAASWLGGGCTTTIQGKKQKARVTLYNRHEDKWGNRIACSSRLRAREGVTVAAERQFPFGTRVSFPALRNIFPQPMLVQDRGSSVESRKASGGTTPVFDLYVSSKRRMKELLLVLPDYTEYVLQ
jgi:hypothetical protein